MLASAAVPAKMSLIPVPLSDIADHKQKKMLADNNHLKASTEVRLCTGISDFIQRLTQCQYGAFLDQIQRRFGTRNLTNLAAHSQLFLKIAVTSSHVACDLHRDIPRFDAR